MERAGSGHLSKLILDPFEIVLNRLYLDPVLRPSCRTDYLLTPDSLIQNSQLTTDTVEIPETGTAERNRPRAETSENPLDKCQLFWPEIDVHGLTPAKLRRRSRNDLTGVHNDHDAVTNEESAASILHP